MKNVAEHELIRDSSETVQWVGLVLEAANLGLSSSTPYVPLIPTMSNI